MKNPFSIVRLIVRHRRPSRLQRMTAVADGFWLGEGYAALTFFGYIVTKTQREADKVNSTYTTLNNHEDIHLRQAQACHDSWVLFYLRYTWYWLKAVLTPGISAHEAYRLNPFEMEAYLNDHDMDYPRRCSSQGGAQQWRRFAKMTLSERRHCYNVV